MHQIFNNILQTCRQATKDAYKVCVTLIVCMPMIIGCSIEPPLHLLDPGHDEDWEFGNIIIDLSVIWDYDWGYDWRKEWYYGDTDAEHGWDAKDVEYFGLWKMKEPRAFEVRRYFKEWDPDAAHKAPYADFVESYTYRSKYQLGYHDVLMWNDVDLIDGVQSLHYDDYSDYERVRAYTNQTRFATRYVSTNAPAARTNMSFYQPEFLVTDYLKNLRVTDNPADYDYIIGKVWYRHVNMLLEPVTYIYLPHIALLHNDKVVAVEGYGNLTGMANEVDLISRKTGSLDIAVNHKLRMKKNRPYRDGKTADIIGGRLVTFGLTDCDPYNISRSDNSYHSISSSKVRNYLEVKMSFVNGKDSLFIFDVTDIVRKRYKGGVIPIEIDCDTLKLPKQSSGFDAGVQDFEDVVYPEIKL